MAAAPSESSAEYAGGGQCPSGQHHGRGATSVIGSCAQASRPTLKARAGLDPPGLGDLEELGVQLHAVRQIGHLDPRKRAKERGISGVSLA